MKINYALIGCGRISPNHIAAALAQESNLNIAAICDLSKENMDNILLMMPEPLRKEVHCYTDYKKMLEEIAPNLCSIATESGKHAAIALDCINSGSNVLIEKPLALSLLDADAIIERAKIKNVLVGVCHQNRFNLSIKKIRQAVEAGQFGKLLHGTAHVLWNRGEQYYTQAPWRGTWEQDGGALMNQCIHNIDLLRWMMGDDIEEVFAYTDNLNHPYFEAEDLGLAVVKFSNGSYGMIEGTTNTYPNNLEETLYIFGNNGTAKVGGKAVNIIEEWRFSNGENSEKVKSEFSETPPTVYGFGHTPLYADMIDAITNNRSPYVDGHAGRRAVELVLAIYRSSKEGKPVKLPMTDFSTMDMSQIDFQARRK